MISDILQKGYVFAVIGVSRDPKKYGHKVYRYLKGRGLRVFPINPKAESILGDRCYPSVKALPEKPNVVVFVVPPKVVESVVDECIEVGIKYAWFQPGSESEKAIRKLTSAKVKVIQGICIMMNT
ncbi:MAG: CoA-binding protein [Thermoprotei archaeon]|nr:MAG: CoA-binding protein [Thermoprotei archaeon]